MAKLSKTKSFSVSSDRLEVDFKGTICDCANLLKSGITNQNTVLVAYDDKWHEINVLDLGGDNSNLFEFKAYIESMKLSLVDLGIIKEKVKTDFSLKHEDFLTLQNAYPNHNYIEISLLNDYNLANGEKASVHILKSWLEVCDRDGITIKELITNREQSKQRIIMEAKQAATTESAKEITVTAEVINESVTSAPVMAVSAPVMAVSAPAMAVSAPAMAVSAPAMAVSAPAPKKPVSLAVFETLTPDRISELQGLKERQESIVKENPIVTITDKSSYEQAKKTAAILLKASTAIDGKEGIESTATKYLNTFKSMLKNALGPIATLTREPYDKQKQLISAWENAELLIEQAEQRAKLEKIQQRTNKLFAVPFMFNGSVYSIGTIYCLPSQIESLSDEDFEVIVNNGIDVKKLIDAENEKKSKLEAENAELRRQIELMQAKPVESVNNPAEASTNADKVNPTAPATVPATDNNPQPTQSTQPQYSLPSAENKLLNRLDLKNVDHLEKPAYIKCRGYYIQGLIDVANEVELILNDNSPNAGKKSDRLASLCQILKQSK